MRIRITATPPGFAPKWVREAWVDIVLESTGRENQGGSVGFNRKGQENLGGYQVQAIGAFAALLIHFPEACQWWEENCPEAALGTLVFHADVCEEIPIRIRITRTPSGGIGPEEIRRAWVGIELDCTKVNQPMTDLCVVTGKPNLHGGYMVNGKEAIEALKNDRPEAYKWWKKHHENAPFGSIVFFPDTCEEVL